jgi:hypothetical protein
MKKDAAMDFILQAGSLSDLKAVAMVEARLASIDDLLGSLGAS